MTAKRRKSPSEADRKLGELMLYVALKSETDPMFGAVKLNKILFYSDFEAYATLGKSITGAPYRKLEFGPAPTRLVPIKKRLEREDAAFERQFPAPGGLEQKRLLTLRRPDLSGFSADEIALVDAIIERARPYSGTDLSEASHWFMGWRLAEMGEEIPYAAAFLPDRPLELSPAEAQYGKELGERLTAKCGQPIAAPQAKGRAFSARMASTRAPND